MSTLMIADFLHKVHFGLLLFRHPVVIISILHWSLSRNLVFLVSIIEKSKAGNDHKGKETCLGTLSKVIFGPIFIVGPIVIFDTFTAATFTTTAVWQVIIHLTITAALIIDSIIKIFRHRFITSATILIITVTLLVVTFTTAAFPIIIHSTFTAALVIDSIIIIVRHRTVTSATILVVTPTLARGFAIGTMTRHSVSWKRICRSSIPNHNFNRF
mmetsp:Transcript_39669/g.46361  ORF Transcript_39669/g.46361 Transcript_39669/m.46361 type:complete len:214 (-) Transcript_39669:1219-1860(-)